MDLGRDDGVSAGVNLDYLQERRRLQFAACRLSAMTALFVVKLDSILEWMAALRGWRSFLAASGLALAILFSFLVQVDRDLALLFLRCGDEKYETAVDFAPRTPDRVISPQDPTIAYRGGGYLGRSLFFELDAHAVNGNWPSELPESMRREVAEANMSCKSGVMCLHRCSNRPR
jgi:hypothetical protein